MRDAWYKNYEAGLYKDHGKKVKKKMQERKEQGLNVGRPIGIPCSIWV